MANINLLPWREELRREKQRQFVSILGLVALLGVVVMALVYTYYSDQIDRQQNRNRLLQSEIRKLDSKIKEIESLEKERKQLKERMELIQELQKSRPQVVHLFDETVVQTPEGVTLQSVERQGNRIIFTGLAESGPRISKFLRNLDNSPWLDKTDLAAIGEDKESGSGRKSFQLTAELISPQQDAAEAD